MAALPPRLRLWMPSRAGIRFSALTREEPQREYRIDALDSVRGIAILAVLYFHFGIFGPAGAHTESEWLYGYAGQVGWAGVDLFFVLSGFLITGILLSTKTSGSYFRNFYARRVLRIFPLYYATLLIIQFTRLHGSGDVYVWTYLQNIQIAVRGWSGTYVAVAHFWSLSVEEQFYLFWPLVVYLCPARKLWAFAAVAAFAAALIRGLLVWKRRRSRGLRSHVQPRRQFAAREHCVDSVLESVGQRFASPMVPCRCSIMRGRVRVGIAGVRRPDRAALDDDRWGCGSRSVLCWTPGDCGYDAQEHENHASIGIAHSSLVWQIQLWHVCASPADTAHNHAAGFTVALLTNRLHSSFVAKLAFDLLSLGVVSLAALVSWTLLEQPFISLKKHFEYNDRSRARANLSLQDTSLTVHALLSSRTRNT